MSRLETAGPIARGADARIANRLVLDLRSAGAAAYATLDADRYAAAEARGLSIGSVFVLRQVGEAATLRLMIVEPSRHGH